MIVGNLYSIVFNKLINLFYDIIKTIKNILIIIVKELLNGKF